MKGLWSYSKKSTQKKHKRQLVSYYYQIRCYFTEYYYCGIKGKRAQCFVSYDVLLALVFIVTITVTVNVVVEVRP